jgi:hypothetical protein
VGAHISMQKSYTFIALYKPRVRRTNINNNPNMNTTTNTGNGVDVDEPTARSVLSEALVCLGDICALPGIAQGPAECRWQRCVVLPCPLLPSPLAQLTPLPPLTPSFANLMRTNHGYTAQPQPQKDARPRPDLLRALAWSNYAKACALYMAAHAAGEGNTAH